VLLGLPDRVWRRDHHDDHRRTRSSARGVHAMKATLHEQKFIATLASGQPGPPGPAGPAGPQGPPGSITPWTEDVDAAGFALMNASIDASEVTSGVIDPDRLGVTPAVNPFAPSQVFLRGDQQWVTPPSNTGPAGPPGAQGPAGP